MLEVIQEYITVIVPYIQYVLPIGLGLIAAFAGTRTIRLIRTENPNKPDWKRWQLRLFSGAIAWTITACFWWTLNGKTIIAFTDGIMYGLVVGISAPLIWKVIIIKVQEYYPNSAILELLHPKRG